MTKGEKISLALKGKPNLGNRGHLNGQWKGNQITYSGVHTWVRRHKPKPTSCDRCRKVKGYDWANISQQYKRSLTDWEWLCRKCHMTKDGRILTFIKANKARSLTWVKCLNCKKPTKPRTNGRTRVRCCSKSCSMLYRYQQIRNQ